MNISEYLVIKRNQDFLIKTSKIIILGFVSFSLFASAIPFYSGFDDVNYGIATINFAKGKFGITNDLDQKTDYERGGAYNQFLPNSYVKTVHNDAIPKSSVGIYPIGAFFYLLGGFFGLYYFGPIITIAVLILFERFSSKLFGNLIGLLALLLLVADWQFFFIGLRFLTDNLFSLFFILGVFSIIKFFHKKDIRFILLSSTFFTLSTVVRINGIIFFPVEVLVLIGFFVIPYLKKFKINTHNNNFEVILKKQIFTKPNFKNFLKISSFLLIPWIIFLVFWLSFNYYYFGDAQTNYQEQMRSESITAAEQEIGSKPTEDDDADDADDAPTRNDFQRLQLVQYYSVPLLPDPLYFFSVITSETDLQVWRSDIWISYITFSVLSIGLIFSLYFKIKRKEILTLLLFIVVIVGFYSSYLVSADPLTPNLSKHANNRYMIPASLLTFTLIGYILVESWRKCFPKENSIHKKILHSVKFIYLILIIVFFLALIVTMPSIQDFYQRGFHFNNPFEAARTLENFEKLPEKSVVVDFLGRNTLLHTDTHFYPYGRIFVLEDGDFDKIPKSKIVTLKNILQEGYSAYAFKHDMFTYDKIYFHFLELNHGIILKDYSNTFCKLELIPPDEQSIENTKSDQICFDNDKTGGNKIWNVTLKWQS